MDKTITRLLGAIIIAALVLVALSMGPLTRLVIGIIIGLPSFLLMLISRRQLGESFTIMPEAKTLVTTGLYYRIQHPLYFFLDLFLVSIIIVLGWSLAALGLDYTGVAANPAKPAGRKGALCCFRC